MGILTQVTLADIWSKYVKYCALTVSAKTQETDAMGLRMLKAMGAESVTDVTAEAVDAQRWNRLEDGMSPRTVNMETAAVLRLLRWAEQRGLIDANPLPSIVRIIDPGDWHFRRALELPEIRALVTASPAKYGRIWLTFLSTGMRRNELIYIRGEDVDLDSMTISLRASAVKTRKARLCYLGSRMAAMLGQFGTESGAPVFPNERGDFHSNNLLVRLKYWVRKAKIDPRGVDLHALRATFYTLGGMAGLPEQTVDTLVGHRSGSVGFRRYWKPVATYLHEAAQKIEDLVWDDVKPEGMV